MFNSTSVVGIACWKLGANSTLTELAEIVPYLDANAKINSGTKGTFIFDTPLPIALLERL
jgi:hypothetical protein